MAHTFNNIKQNSQYLVVSTCYLTCCYVNSSKQVQNCNQKLASGTYLLMEAKNWDVKKGHLCKYSKK